MLFDQGRFQLTEDGSQLAGAIGSALEKIPSPYRIGVEGHTDDTPIASGGFEDNWELSTLRAHSVFKALHLSEEAKTRTVLMGYGDVKPLFPNRDESGRILPANQARNRRVTIRIF